MGFSYTLLRCFVNSHLFYGFASAFIVIVQLAYGYLVLWQYYGNGVFR